MKAKNKGVFQIALAAVVLAINFIITLSAQAGFIAVNPMSVDRVGHSLTLLTDGTALAAGGYEGTNTVLSSAEIYNPGSGTWTATSPLNTGRIYHTATLLQNGKVLLAGGLPPGSAPLSSAEIFDPATGMFTATGSMSSARYGHAAALLPDGKVLVAGGEGATNMLASAELYDPTTGQWTVTGSMTNARSTFAAMLLTNGQVLAVGGDSTSIATITKGTAELYNPATGQWTQTGSLNVTNREYCATVLLNNGKVLLVGGFNPANRQYLTSTEIYDPIAGTWSLTGSMTIGRANHTAITLADGKVLVVGGTCSSGNAYGSSELYDPVTGSWSVGGSSTQGRDNTPAVLLTNGKVLLAGGNNINLDGANPGLRYTASAEVFDPNQSELNNAREDHTATLMPSGKVLVAGGRSTGGVAGVSELFDPGTGGWLTSGTLNTLRKQHTANLLLNGKVLVAGGVDTNGNALTSTEVYDSTAGTWT